MQNLSSIFMHKFYPQYLSAKLIRKIYPQNLSAIRTRHPYSQSAIYTHSFYQTIKLFYIKQPMTYECLAYVKFQKAY